MDGSNETQTHARLQGIAQAYQGRLQPSVRQSLIQQGVAFASTSRRRGWIPNLEAFPRLVSVAAAAAVLALFATVSLYEPKPSPVNNLQAQTLDGHVILTWQDGDRPHEIVRLTSREMLRQGREQAGEIVRGERWVDSRTDDSPIVFYLVN